MAIDLQDPKFQSILTHPQETDTGWKDDLKRFQEKDISLDRKTAGENSIKAFQRLLIFLGYSTSSGGSFTIDGDFGRGTNRAVAQFQFEHGLNPAITRDMLCYDCTSRTARKNIRSIPNVILDLPTLEKMIEVAGENIQANKVNCGSLNDALFQLNALHKRRLLSCREIHQQFGELAGQASRQLESSRGVTIRPQWILSIIKKETGGVVRPRFEQHWLSKFNKSMPDEDISELRFRSMSFGLGQVMGFNYKRVGATSAKAMFYSPMQEQILFVGRYLASGRSKVRAALAKNKPDEQDFRAIAKFYNGPRYEINDYHESLGKWFKEFSDMELV